MSYSDRNNNVIFHDKPWRANLTSEDKAVADGLRNVYCKMAGAALAAERRSVGDGAVWPRLDPDRISWETWENGVRLRYYLSPARIAYYAMSLYGNIWQNRKLAEINLVYRMREWLYLNGKT